MQVATQLGKPTYEHVFTCDGVAPHVPKVRQLRLAANRNRGPAAGTPVGPRSDTKLRAIEMPTGPWGVVFWCLPRETGTSSHTTKCFFSPKMFCLVLTRNGISTTEVLVGHDSPAHNSVNFGHSHVGCSPVLRVAVLWT